MEGESNKETELKGNFSLFSHWGGKEESMILSFYNTKEGGSRKKEIY